MLHVDRATDLLVAVCYDRREAIQGCGPVLAIWGSIISQRLGSKARRACRRRPRPSGGYSPQTSVKGSPPAEPAPRGIW